MIVLGSVCERSLEGGTYFPTQRVDSGFNVSTAKMPESNLYCVRMQTSTWLVDTTQSSNRISAQIFSVPF